MARNRSIDPSRRPYSVRSCGFRSRTSSIYRNDRSGRRVEWSGRAPAFNLAKTFRATKLTAGIDVQHAKRQYSTIAKRHSNRNGSASIRHVYTVLLRGC